MLPRAGGGVDILNNYNVTNNRPRPESYMNDLHTASLVPPEQQAALWANIATVRMCVCS